MAAPCILKIMLILNNNMLLFSFFFMLVESISFNTRDYLEDFRVCCDRVAYSQASDSGKVDGDIVSHTGDSGICPKYYGHPVRSKLGYAVLRKTATRNPKKFACIARHTRLHLVLICQWRIKRYM